MSTDLKAQRDRSVLLVVDLQPTFLKPIPDAQAIIDRSKFLVEVATLLGVPILSTTQVAGRMGGMAPDLAALLPGEPIDKVTFSCCGQPLFVEALKATGRDQVVMVGAETHICIAQTTLDLLAAGYEVQLACDAITGRGLDARATAFGRLAAAGAQLTHTESVTYEWLLSAEDPKFRDVLGIVKRAAAASSAP